MPFFTRMLMISAVITATSSAAHAQLLDDRANIKILKARSQLLTTNSDSIQDKLGDQIGLGENVGGRIECGSVEIGNDFGTASTGIGREISVIITGDIINTDNRCVNTNVN